MQTEEQLIAEYQKECFDTIQKAVSNPDGKIHIECSMLEAERWRAHLFLVSKSINTRYNNV